MTEPPKTGEFITRDGVRGQVHGTWATRNYWGYIVPPTNPDFPAALAAANALYEESQRVIIPLTDQSLPRGGVMWQDDGYWNSNLRLTHGYRQTPPQKSERDILHDKLTDEALKLAALRSRLQTAEQGVTELEGEVERLRRVATYLCGPCVDDRRMRGGLCKARGDCEMAMLCDALSPAPDKKGELSHE